MDAKHEVIKYYDGSAAGSRFCDRCGLFCHKIWRKKELKKIFRVFCMITISLSLLLCNGARARAEEYQYDDLDRLVKVTYEDGSYTKYSYDANGNLLEVIVYDANPKPSATPNPEESSEASEVSSETGIPESSEPMETTKPETNEETTESSSESGDGSETASQSNEEHQEEPEDEKNIVERIIAAVEEFFTKVINWFKKWF